MAKGIKEKLLEFAGDVDLKDMIYVGSEISDTISKFKNITCIAQYIKMKSFINAINKKINQENLKKYIEKFGDKHVLGTYINKQVDSNHKIGNAICGLIISQALKDGELGDEDINYIEFLLELTENDIDNYIYICDLLISKKNEEGILEFKEIKNRNLIQTTVSKMNKYSLADNNRNVSLSGGIASNKNTLGLYEKYLKYLVSVD